MTGLTLGQIRPLKSWQIQLALFCLVIMAASISVWILPPYEPSIHSLEPPSTKHWLGTNDIGQDVFIGILTATPNTVFVALFASLLSLSISIAIAAMAAIRGGITATIILRLVDIFQVIPSILILLLLAAWIQPNFLGLILLLSLTTWHDDIRVLRAIFLRELTRENVHYAKRLGGSWRYCFSRHILPAIWPVIMGLFVQQIRQATMKTAGLGFLGLTDPGLVTWGSLMQDALEYLYGAEWLWLLLPPGLCLSLFLLFVISMSRRLEQHSMADKAEQP